MVKIATILSVHNDVDLVLDTLDSVLEYMTEDVLLLIDGASKEFDNIDLPVHKLKGFRHGITKSPYKNVALGLKNVVELFPDADWYCYLEYDCLITSIRFKYNLEMATDRDIWMLGCDGHVDDKDIPLVSAMLKTPLNSSYYLLGACQFFSKFFMEKLKEINFFDRFLSLTNEFSGGDMPGYSGYDVSEHLYPTLCRQFGGNIGVFSSWDNTEEKWHGSHEVFPVRWQPEITEKYTEASIYHPLKNYDSPIRQYYRKIRKLIKEKKYVSSTL